MVRLHWNRQSFFLLLFAVMWIIPNIVLVYIRFSWLNLLANGLFPFTIGLSLLAVFRKPGIMVLLMLPMLIIHAYEIVFLYLFGREVITTDMFLNTVTTDVEESTELLSNIYPAIIIVCLLYIPLIILAVVSCRMKERLHAGFRRTFSLLSAIAALIMAGIILISGTRMDVSVYPLNMLYNFNFAVNKWYRERNYPVTSAGFTFNAARPQHAPQREVYVLVIGESARAMNWQLLGYSLPTNPELSRVPGLFVFSNITSQSNATQKSVPLILSAANASNSAALYSQKSVLSLFKEAGFKTVFITNQVANQQLIGFYSREADERIDINKGIAENTAGKYDENMLPVLSQVIDQDSSNLLIVLHMHGSHFNYAYRYPPNYAVFRPDQPLQIKIHHKQALVNAYNNTIVYTDHFLAEVIRTLSARQLCTGMLYVSDHGENLFDDDRRLFLHSTPFPTIYELHIPLLIWLSPQYVRAWPGKAESTAQNIAQPADTRVIFHTLCDMAGITTPYFRPDESLMNKNFVPQEPRMILGDHEHPQNFNRYFQPEDEKVLSAMGRK
ncbi:phosphoethanolamine transferase [Chitinophaga arvensicola]|uniref:Phosphoethanolamine transferase for glucans (OPG), alkaline phosphatase superfamily n=1 Tax=Chitinophaga arvensicola TaxID=29529 RepID=A0A1I0S8J0_9BACT|nr:phosphoethanolamine transferase [Chitinophaga arvensicola]SEW52398.1 Phosphoethanolamine transferase for glucans (OPG), alkaline phosphatase superfamily [Chitinophaga arvensicola]